MLLRQMELFVLAAESGSLSKVAKQAFLSVAAVSQQITSLEKEIGAPLFIRTNRGVQLTQQGELFYIDAKSILRQIKQALQRAKENASDLKRLVLGGFGSDANKILPSVFLKIVQEYPEIELSISSIDFNRIEEELLSSNIDLCFVYGQDEGSIRSPLLKYTKLFEDKLFLSVSKQSKLTAKQEVSLSDLRDQHLILIKKGFSNVYDKIRKVIEKEEPTIKITDCTENSVENACRLHALECCYLVPRLFESNNPNRTLLPVNFIDFISIGVIYRKASPQFIINQVIPLCSKVLQQI